MDDDDIMRKERICPKSGGMLKSYDHFVYGELIGREQDRRKNED